MVLGALVAVCEHLLFLHPESGHSQPACERCIGVGGPDRQNASWAQRIIGGAQAAVRVKTVVPGLGEAFGTIVRVEQNGVVGALSSSDQFKDIAVMRPPCVDRSKACRNARPSVLGST